MEPVGEPDKRDVRRPMNAFLIFCKRHRSMVRERNPDLDNRSVTRILGDLWANLQEQEKTVYTDLAKQYKDAFMKANPDYKWHNPEKAPANQKTAPKPTNMKVIKNDVDIMSEGSIMLGKLADPSNMGGLSLLLMAGQQSLGSKQTENQSKAVADQPKVEGNQSKPEKTKPDWNENQTKSAPSGDEASGSITNTALLELAEMCSNELGTKKPKPSQTKDKPNTKQVKFPFFKSSRLADALLDQQDRGGKAGAKGENCVDSPSANCWKKGGTAGSQIETRHLKNGSHFVGNKMGESHKVDNLASGFPSADNSVNGGGKASVREVDRKSLLSVEKCNKVDGSGEAGDSGDGSVPGVGGDEVTKNADQEALCGADGKMETEDEAPIVACGKMVVNHIIDRLFCSERPPPPGTVGQQDAARENGDSSKRQTAEKTKGQGQLDDLDECSGLEEKAVSANGLSGDKLVLDTAEDKVGEAEKGISGAAKQGPDPDSVADMSDPVRPGTQWNGDSVADKNNPERPGKQWNGDGPGRLVTDQSTLPTTGVKKAAENGIKKKSRGDKQGDTERRTQVEEKKEKVKNHVAGNKRCAAVLKENGVKTDEVDGIGSAKKQKAVVDVTLKDGDKDDTESDEKGDNQQPVRKSRRRNRGQRYQELINEGIIQPSKERLAALMHGQQDDSEQEEFQSIDAHILPETAIRRSRKRTASESDKGKMAAMDDAKRYKTGDFDLEAHIAGLPACSIDSVGRKRGFVKQRHHSESCKRQEETTLDTVPLTEEPQTVSLPPRVKIPSPEKSDEPVTGSRKRKARKHSITHLLPVPSSGLPSQQVVAVLSSGLETVLSSPAVKPDTESKLACEPRPESVARRRCVSFSGVIEKVDQALLDRANLRKEKSRGGLATLHPGILLNKENASKPVTIDNSITSLGMSGVSCKVESREDASVLTSRKAYVDGNCPPSPEVTGLKLEQVKVSDSEMESNHSPVSMATESDQDSCGEKREQFESSSGGSSPCESPFTTLKDMAEEVGRVKAEKLGAAGCETLKAVCGGVNKTARRDRVSALSPMQESGEQQSVDCAQVDGGYQIKDDVKVGSAMQQNCVIERCPADLDSQGAPNDSNGHRSPLQSREATPATGPKSCDRSCDLNIGSKSETSASNHGDQLTETHRLPPKAPSAVFVPNGVSWPVPSKSNPVSNMALEQGNRCSSLLEAKQVLAEVVDQAVERNGSLCKEVGVKEEVGAGSQHGEVMKGQPDSAEVKDESNACDSSSVYNSGQW